MNATKIIVLAVVAWMSVWLPLPGGAQRILLLGDIHYDRIENHNEAWLRAKGDDWRQVTEEYCVWTRDNWPGFSRRIVAVADSCDAVIQLGDLSEGLAGDSVKAVEMAYDTFRAIDSLQLRIPMIAVKGNHDITGPGAKEAFKEVYLPAMSRLSHRTDTLRSANYATSVGPDIFVACYDPWDPASTPEALDSMLASSDAAYKFVALHEPVIPINHRCWHVYRKDQDKRNRLLKAIASNNAIVLCAHMHKYAVVSRSTPWGRIVQISVNSVIRDLDRTGPVAFSREYGQAMFDGHMDWQPSELAQRREWIEAETPYVDYYVFADIPGYGILEINGGVMVLKYFYGAESDAIDTVNITDLYSN